MSACFFVAVVAVAIVVTPLWLAVGCWCGYCTQCGRDLINDGEKWEDDETLQMDHELIRKELSKD